jgi:alanine-synthesizing transaminase
VQTALGGHQSIQELVKPGGRLFQTRQAVIEGIKRSKYLQVVTPQGAMYAFVQVKIPGFNDKKFALDLLEQQNVLVAPGTSFNVPYEDHFRITLLPDEKTMAEVLSRIETQLDKFAKASAG